MIVGPRRDEGPQRPLPAADRPGRRLASNFGTPLHLAVLTPGEAMLTPRGRIVAVCDREHLNQLGGSIVVSMFKTCKQ